jgi:hypothetical protein
MNPQSIISEFRILESQGLVRLRALPETESYFDVYGEPDSAQERQEIIDQIESNGCWFVVSEFHADGSWHHADSVGMCVGYSDVLDPAENCYIEGLMDSAVRAAESNSVAI